MTPVPMHCRLAWLAGLWDGEGCFGIYRATIRGHVGYKSTANVVNTNAAIIQEAASILETLGIRFSLDVHKPQKNNHRPCHRLSVCGPGNLKLLPLLIPFLVGKRGQAELVLRFCQRREAIRRSNPPLLVREPGGHGIATCIRTDGYSDEDAAMATKMSEMNRRGTAPVKED